MITIPLKPNYYHTSMCNSLRGPQYPCDCAKQTIPHKPDGSPDWKTIEEKIYGDDAGLGMLTSTELIKKFYIAALERCAQWHDECIASVHQLLSEDIAAGDTMYNRELKQEFITHKESAATIRQWIKKQEKQG